MAALARGVSGMVPVGLKAVELVKLTYRWSMNDGDHARSSGRPIVICGNSRSARPEPASTRTAKPPEVITSPGSCAHTVTRYGVG